jgi:hypothetical protein
MGPAGGSHPPADPVQADPVHGPPARPRSALAGVRVACGWGGPHSPTRCRAPRCLQELHLPEPAGPYGQLFSLGQALAGLPSLRSLFIGLESDPDRPTSGAMVAELAGGPWLRTQLVRLKLRGACLEPEADEALLLEACAASASLRELAVDLRCACAEPRHVDVLRRLIERLERLEVRTPHGAVSPTALPVLPPGSGWENGRRCAVACCCLLPCSWCQGRR